MRAPGAKLSAPSRLKALNAPIPHVWRAILLCWDKEALEHTPARGLVSLAPCWALHCM